MTAVLAGEASAKIEGVMAGDVAMERIVRPVVMPGLNATWALVMDVPNAAITWPADKLARILFIGGLGITAAVLLACSSPAPVSCASRWPA
ncbi:hypothetical protein [Caulobacter sp. B11]|uniref:hypothetical protein n=1 Tax=Caulobacter sp. B11 TaxID=2048899 RepID=UPI001F2B5365|nr:hypothetical protein [Caulobacter sp. B11]